MPSRAPRPWGRPPSAVRRPTSRAAARRRAGGAASGQVAERGGAPSLDRPSPVDVGTAPPPHRESRGPGVRQGRERVWQQLISSPPGVEDLLDAKRISLSLIDPNPDQPRGELREIPELAGSIVEHGLIQPIVVAQLPSGRYQIVAGHRRFAAYKLLFDTSDEPSRWMTIPAIEREATTAQRRMMALVENVSRHNLTDAEIVTELRVLHDLEGLHQAEIARRLGVSRAWIMQYFRVAGDPAVSEHVQTEQLSVAKAYDIVLAKTDEARQAALSAALQGAPRRLVRQIAKEGPQAARDPQQAADRAAASAGAAGGEQPDGADGPAGPGPADGERADAAAGPAGAGPAGWAGAPYVATAATEAGVRDVADLAGELGLTIELRDLQLTRLFRAAIEAQTGTLDLRDFIRAARVDLRRADALARAAPRARRD